MKSLVGVLAAGGLAMKSVGSCAEGEIGSGQDSPGGELAILLKLSSSDSGKADGDTGLQGKDQAGIAFAVSAAQGYVRDIELELAPGATCEAKRVKAPVTCESDEVRVVGPFHVDLVTGTATPSLSGLTIPAGVYARIDVRFEEAKPADGVITAGSAIDGHSLLASGTFPWEGAPMPFDLALAFNEDARFEDPAGISVVPDGAKDILLGLDVAGWFSTLPITDCFAKGDLDEEGGILHLGDGSGACQDIETSLKEAIKKSGSLD